MTVISNNLAQEEEVEAEPKTLLDRLLKTWRGKEIGALKAWHKNELWALEETLKHRQEVALEALAAKHQVELREQKNTWILNQKLRATAHVHGQHGNLIDMEHRRLITTTISPEGFVEWTVRQNGA